MNQDLTPVTVFTVMASSVFGVQMAYLIGPYIVIGIGALGGSAVMVMQRQGDGNVRAFVYFLAAAALAMLLTVPLSMMAESLYTPLKAQWLFAPFSFALGYIGDKYPAVLAWCGSKIGAVVDMLIAARGAK